MNGNKVSYYQHLQNSGIGILYLDLPPQPSPSILNDLAKHSPWVNSCGFSSAYFQSQDMIQQGV